MIIANNKNVTTISPPSTPLTGGVMIPPSSQAIQGTFYNSQLFNPIYQRNNKKGNIKNLRCFPCCSQDQHKLRGFCGRSVLVSFTCKQDSTKTYMSFVEFAPVDAPLPAERIPCAMLREKIRTKQEPTNAWIQGVSQFVHLDKSKMWFEFNAELKGWHYSWESNKHKCDTKHQLVCMLYMREGEDLVLVSTCTSPEFILFCRRRKRFVLEPSSGGGGTIVQQVDNGKRAKVQEDEDEEEDGATDALLAFMNGSHN